jgi:uncharacterized membrane protein YfbV (UPF0208 family)
MSFDAMQVASNFLAIVSRMSGIWWAGRINAIPQEIHWYRADSREIISRM